MDLFTQPLIDVDNWMATSNSNYGLYFVIVGALILAGLIGLKAAAKVIGKTDERTEKMYARVLFDMLVILGITATLFVSNLSPALEYTEQLFLIVFAITTLGGAVSGFVRNNLSLR